MRSLIPPEHIKSKAIEIMRLLDGMSFHDAMDAISLVSGELERASYSLKEQPFKLESHTPAYLRGLL